MRENSERLQDMLEAIGKIEQYVNREGKYEDFAQDELREVWVIHHLQIIGEAASRLSLEFRNSHPEVAWGKMIGMRHVLVHGYFETDSEIIWEVIDRDLPILKEQLEKIVTKNN